MARTVEGVDIIQHKPLAVACRAVPVYHAAGLVGVLEAEAPRPFPSDQVQVALQRRAQLVYECAVRACAAGPQVLSVKQSLECRACGYVLRRG